MSIQKQHISSPIEAGKSIIDAHNLPLRMPSVLEYVSKRLTRKGVHITLVVVKDEHQIPTTPPCATPTSPPQTPESLTSGSASPSYFTAPIVGLKRLVRRGTASSSASSNSSTSASSTFSSEMAVNTRAYAPMPSPPIDSPTSPRRWFQPGSPHSSPPLTPHTPLSISTMTTATSSSSASNRFQSPEPHWARLVYTSPVTEKEDKIVRAAMSKAERKFQTKSGELPAITAASACGLNDDLMRRSIRQNEVLFSSEGLTLLALDRLYSFKAALTAYAKSITAPNPRTRTPLCSPGLSNHPVKIIQPPPTPGISYSLRLEDAVDSLRRLILSNGDRPVARADLYRSFDWMGVNPTALADVERMYKRAYGGPDRRDPFESPPIIEDEEVEQSREAKPRRMGFIKLGTPPPPRGQTAQGLRVNTQLCTNMAPDVREHPNSEARVVDDDEDSTKTVEHNYGGDLDVKIDRSDTAVEVYYERHEQEGGHTTLPTPHKALPQSVFWLRNGSMSTSIDEVMLPCDERQSMGIGPITPNNYDDISPITRGEWGFLFKGGTWTQPRTAVVETC